MDIVTLESILEAARDVYADDDDKYDKLRQIKEMIVGEDPDEVWGQDTQF